MNKRDLVSIINLTDKVEQLLLKHNELELYDIEIKRYPGHKNFTIILKDVNSETYTILDPQDLGINI